MSRGVVVNHVTLDGVMQAPARPDEDRRGGFTRGGWALPYSDEVMAQRLGRNMSQGGSLLLGRRTYEDFYSVWPSRTDNPYTEVLNNTQKYVTSTTLAEPLPWQNSTLLTGDAAQAVAGLRQQPGLRQQRVDERPAAAWPDRRVRDADPPAGAGVGAAPVP